MKPTTIAILWLCLAAAPAAADSFGGVSGNEKLYVIGTSKVCMPIVVTGGAAHGAAVCQAATTTDLANLSLKNPPPERGKKAEVAAAAKGRTITVTAKDGSILVAWDAADPIASIVDVWRSPVGRVVAVEYTVRLAGREVHQVVGFDLGQGGHGAADPGTDAGTDTHPDDPGKVTPPPPADPVLTKAVAKARKTTGKAAIAAWGKVLALDGDHAEARYRTAVAYAQARRPDDAVAALTRLAASTRADAVEWLVEARFDKAFAKLVDRKAFRDAVGFDRTATGSYERLMGFGGQWEQALVPCDRPEMRLSFARDRSFKLEFRSTCEGQREGFSMKGSWAVAGDTLEVRLAKPGGKGADAAPCVFRRDGDEDVLGCQFDQDLSFEGRPVRR